MEIIAAIPMAIKRQGPVAAGPTPNALQSLPPTVLKEQDESGTAAPLVHLELLQKARTAFVTPTDGMKSYMVLIRHGVWAAE